MATNRASPKLDEVGVIYSLVDPAYVARLVAAEYDVGMPTDCRPLYAGHNDTYEVKVDQQRYAFRLHTRGKWWLDGESDARFELELLDHLHQQAVPVSHPLPRRSGDLLGILRAPEGERIYSLFTWADGGHVDELTRDQAYLVGQTMAKIHVAADLFEPAHSRYRLDERTLLDRSLDGLDSELREASSDDVETIRHHVAEIRTRLAAYDPGPGGWGIIHGDVYWANFHFDGDDRVTSEPMADRSLD